MTNHESIIETLRTIDEKTDFSVRNDSDIITIIRDNLANKEEQLDTFSLAEFYAFTLYENSPRGIQYWNTYFGSPIYYDQHGEECDRIPLEKITCEIVNYWKQRLTQSKSSLIKARYAGLIWDLELKVCNKRPDYHSIAIPYVTNLLASVGGEKILSFPAAREKLRRAIDLAIKLKNQELRRASIEAILLFQQKRLRPDAPGTWRVSYDLLVESGIVLGESFEYVAIIDWLQLLFDKACYPDGQGKVDINAVETVFESLLAQYLKTDDITKINSALAKMEACYRNRIKVCSAGEAIHWLEKLRRYFQQANLKERMDQVSVELEELGPRLITEMKVIRVENTFSKDGIDRIVEEILSLPHEDIFKALPRLIFRKTDELMNWRKESETSLLDLLTKDIYTKLGRKVATIGSSDEDSRGTAIQQMQIQMGASFILLHFILSASKERNILSGESFMQFVSKSNVISPDRYPILKMAFEHWLTEDHIVALHLLIPQIEAACLTLVKREGKPICSNNKYGGYNVRLFGDLLREEVLLQTLGKEGVDYFMTLFTDPRGYNLRNEVAHGLRDTDGFDANMSNAVLIALLHVISNTFNNIDKVQ